MFRFSLALAALVGLAPLPALAQQGYAWAYSSNVSANPLETYLGVVYGVPQTDDMQAHITCHIGANWIYGMVSLGANVGEMAPETSVSVTLAGAGYQATYNASVVHQDEGIWGVDFSVGLDDPLWTAMMGNASLTYAVNGGEPRTLDLTDAAGPVHEFLGDCLSIGDLVPIAPPAPAASK